MKANFKKEFKRQIRLAIAAAIGFIIAFAWRDFILRVTEGILGEFLTLNTTTSSLIIALFLTFVGVILILISSKILK